MRDFNPKALQVAVTHRNAVCQSPGRSEEEDEEEQEEEEEEEEEAPPSWGLNMESPVEVDW